MDFNFRESVEDVSARRNPPKAVSPANGRQSFAIQGRKEHAIMQKIVPFLWFDNNADPEKGKRVMQAMLQMKKIDIAGLQRAHDQK
jgi:hypothetical protein